MLRVDDAMLVHLLLVFVVLELAIFRLAVPALLPPGDELPPRWHQGLAWVGLFLFYFATVFAIAVTGRELYNQLRRRDLYAEWIRYALVGTGAALLLAALVSLLWSTTETTTFALDAVFTLAVAVVVVGQITSRGDLGARIGLVLLATPLIIHFYAPFALRFISGDDIALPEKVQIFGQWSLVFAALATPYCFAPRPFALSASRIPPLVVAMFIAVVSSVIVRRSYEVGMELATRGLGVDLGPGAPTSMLALYIMALAAVTWTLVSCLSADSGARRLIGTGLGLVLLGGYAFSWPLQYLAGFVGLVVIGGAAARVRIEEADTTGVRSQPIDGETWQAYVSKLVAALRERAGDAGQAPSAVTVRDEGEILRTHVVWQRDGIPYRLTAVRQQGRVQHVDIVGGVDVAIQEAPALTLHARRSDSPVAHPEPPGGAGRPSRTGDPAFDQRFRMRGDPTVADELFDDALRARSVTMLDGWLAYWSGKAIQYRVLPGLGAPLDHPIPISELASRGVGAPPDVERMLGLIDLIGDLGSRVIEPPAGRSD
jgi:hypothetical protein